MYDSALKSLKQQISDVKIGFLTDKIKENLGKRSLYKIVDSFLLPKPPLSLPHHVDLLELVERFSSYFSSKVNAIRAELEAAAINHHHVEPAPR